MYYYQGESIALSRSLRAESLSQSWSLDIESVPFIGTSKDWMDFIALWIRPACADYYTPGDMNAESFAPILQSFLRPQAKEADFVKFGFAFFNKVPCALMLTYLQEDPSVWALVLVEGTNEVPYMRRIQVLSSVDFPIDERFIKEPEGAFREVAYLPLFFHDHQINPDCPLLFRFLASKKLIKQEFINALQTTTLNLQQLSLVELQSTEAYKKLDTQKRCFDLLLDAQEEFSQIATEQLQACMTPTSFLFQVLPLLKNVNHDTLRRKMVASLLAQDTALRMPGAVARIQVLILLLNQVNKDDIVLIQPLLHQFYSQPDYFDEVLDFLLENHPVSADISSFLSAYFSPDSLLQKMIAQCFSQSRPELLEMLIFLHKQKLLPFLVKMEGQITNFSEWHALIQEENKEFRQWYYFFWIKFPALDFREWLPSMQTVFNDCPLLCRTLLRNHASGIQNGENLADWLGSKKDNYLRVIQTYFLQKDIDSERFSETALIQVCSALELLESLQWDKKCYREVHALDTRGLLLRCILPTLKAEPVPVQQELIPVVFDAVKIYSPHFSRLLHPLSCDQSLKDSLTERCFFIRSWQTRPELPDVIFWASQPTLEAKCFRDIFFQVENKIAVLFENHAAVKTLFDDSFYPLVYRVLKSANPLQENWSVAMNQLEADVLAQMGQPMHSKVEQFFVNLMNFLAKIFTLGFVRSWQEKRTGQAQLWGRTKEGVAVFQLFKGIKEKLSEANSVTADNYESLTY